MADPYIVADDGVSLVGPLLRHCRCPCSSEDGEGIVREPIGAVIAAVHDELHSGGDGTELADDESVADEVEVVEDVPFELLHAGGVIVVGIVADQDVWARYVVLQESCGASGLPTGRGCRAKGDVVCHPTHDTKTSLVRYCHCIIECGSGADYTCRYAHGRHTEQQDAAGAAGVDGAYAGICRGRPFTSACGRIRWR